MASVNSNTSPDRQSSSTPLLEGSQNAPPNEATTVESISSSSSRRVRFRHIVSLLASPVTDDRGHWTAVLAGLSSLFIVGIFFGLSVPKNPIFSASYGSISSCLGYTYFLVWSFSFYPQVLSNYRRKTTTGLSVDFCSLNLTGFLCYAVSVLTRLVDELMKGKPASFPNILFSSHNFCFILPTYLFGS
jgi:uncharacterized protein with PQ loop repeat